MQKSGQQTQVPMAAAGKWFLIILTIWYGDFYCFLSRSRIKFQRFQTKVFLQLIS